MEKRGLYVKKITKSVDDYFFFRIFERYFTIIGTFCTWGDMLKTPSHQSDKKIKNNINEFQMELRTTYIRKTASG